MTEASGLKLRPHPGPRVVSSVTVEGEHASPGTRNPEQDS
jgi:hypothetical protein